jgi:kynurenine 3-monooxygenase
MEKTFAIVGGGPSGLISAISFARRGIATTVFEAAECPLNSATYNPSRSYAIDISGHGFNAINYINAVDRFNKAMIQFDGVKLEDKVVTPWNEPGWIGSRGDIVRVMVNLVNEKYSDLITIKYNHRITAVDVHQGRLTIESPVDSALEGNNVKCHEETFDCIVAADGGGSVLRAQAEQQDPDYNLTKKDVGYHCKMVTMNRNTEALDPNYLQVLSPKGFCVAGAINGPEGPAEPLWFCFVPYESDVRFDSLQEVKDHFKDRCPKLLNYVTDDELTAFASRPSQNIGRVTQSSRLYAGKVIFLGDAAISYPPIGQGINGAMESSMILDQCLGRAGFDTEGATIDDQMLTQMARMYNDIWHPETMAVSWLGMKNVLAKPWHKVRALTMELLKMNVLHDTKRSDMSYSEVYKRAKRQGPFWIM